MKFFKMAVIIFFIGGLTACVTPKIKTYVDPLYKGISKDQIKSVSKKQAIKVDVEFQNNGKHNQRVDALLRSYVEQTLLSSGVVLLDKNALSSIKVTANNIGDIGQAVGKGLVSGFTLGKVGSTVQDFYEIKIEYRRNNKKTIRKNYKHTIHSFIGNVKAPATLEATTQENAFGLVVEDIILKFLLDMQENNILTLNSIANLQSA